MNVRIEVFWTAGKTLGRNSKHRFQVAEPGISPDLKVPLPTRSFAGFHRRTKPVIGNCQVRFYVSPSRALPEQPQNKERLRQAEYDAADDVPLVRFPNGGLPVQHDADGREDAAGRQDKGNLSQPPISTLLFAVSLRGPLPEASRIQLFYASLSSHVHVT